MLLPGQQWPMMGQAFSLMQISRQQHQTMTGIMDWSAHVYPATFSSTEIFPSITPVQSVQSGVSYPYWDTYSHPGMIKIHAQSPSSFQNVLNCRWIQNVVWVIYRELHHQPQL